MTTTDPTPQCIRRPYAVWTSCRCDECVPLQRKTAKLYRHDYLMPTHDALRERAWAVLDRWITAAWSPSAMASASGLPVRYFDSLMGVYRKGHRQRIGPKHAEAIINHQFPVVGRMTALGTTRRLQALAALGWRLQDVQDRVDVPYSTLEALRLTGRVAATRVEVVQAVARVYDKLSMTPGPSGWTRAHAERNRWAPPLAWDDIDDPYERPNRSGTGSTTTSEGQIGELAHLMAWEHWTWEGITHRLGVKKDAIYALCTRNKRYDLLARLQATDPDFKGDVIPVRGAWTMDQMRAAHAAHTRGEGGLWVRAGEAEYQRTRKQRARSSSKNDTTTQEDAA